MHTYQCGSYVITVIPAKSSEGRDRLRKLEEELERHRERDRQRFDEQDRQMRRHRKPRRYFEDDEEDSYPEVSSRSRSSDRSSDRYEATNRSTNESAEGATDEHYPEVQPHRVLPRYRSRSESVVPVDDYQRSRSMLEGNEGDAGGAESNRR
jgi:hypothetical protein